MVKSQFEDFMRASSPEEPEIVSTNNDLYWWPIGSAETSEVGGKLFDDSHAHYLMHIGYKFSFFHLCKLYLEVNYDLSKFEYFFY